MDWHRLSSQPLGRGNLCKNIYTCTYSNTSLWRNSSQLKLSFKFIFRWQRLPRENVFYYKSPLHHDNSVLSFAFSFDREDERYSFALAQPYSLARFNEHISTIMEKTLPYISVETIAHTIQQRPCQMLTITNPCNLERTLDVPYPSNPLYNSPPPKVIVILGRVRASEAPSSFIIQGLIDFLVSDHEIAHSLREHLVFKIVPVVNPDGVFLGNTRGNLLGMDLNRCWQVAKYLLNISVIFLFGFF